MSNVFLENDLEILIATQDRSDLGFLSKMFPFKHFSNYTILIINQSNDAVLTSGYPSVRVINSTEIGLSRSRNLAIAEAEKKICLLTDDDVVYFPDFEKEIVKAFEKNPDSSIITFNHKRIGLEKPNNTSQKGYVHTAKSILKVCSIEIAFQLEDIKKSAIYFDEDFGLGSFFETAEEYLFLRKALRQDLKSYYCPAVIVSHPLLSSGKLEGSDELLFAKAALFYKINGRLAYLWLMKYLFFLYRHHYVKKANCFEKLKIGLSGIEKYRMLNRIRNN